MSNIVYIGTSLDGYIADNKGGLEWLEMIPNPENLDLGFSDFMNRIDALVMGRNTYEMVLSFGTEWPYAKPVFVLSNSLKAVPEELKKKVQIIKGTPDEIVVEMSSRGYKNLYIDGGKTIQGFLEADLIDEMIITRLPILLGGGASLFSQLSEHKKFKHVSTDVLLGEMVCSRYKRIR